MRNKAWVVVSVDGDRLVGIWRYALRANAEFHRDVLYQRHPTGTYRLKFDPAGKVECLNDRVDGNTVSRF